ncbi:MAG: HAD-IA family hydrolase, partial [Acidimicrobiales bacterium]
RRTWSEHGHELLLEEWVLCVGGGDLFDPVGALAARVGTSFDEEAVLRATLAHQVELGAATEARHGIEAWLEAARRAGVPVGVASSSPRPWVDGHLARLGLTDRFLTVQTVTEVGVTKPDPASYLAACAALGVDPLDALAVEDSAHGLAAALAAGMRAVAFPNPITAGLDLSAAHLLVGDLREWTLAEAWAAVTDPQARGRAGRANLAAP